jgi:hypothetical protein
VHAQQAELAELGGQLAHRHLAGLEPFGDVRPQPLFAEFTHGLPDRQFLGFQHLVDVEQVVDTRRHDPCLHPLTARVNGDRLDAL